MKVVTLVLFCTIIVNKNRGFFLSFAILFSKLKSSVTQPPRWSGTQRTARRASLRGYLGFRGSWKGSRAVNLSVLVCLKAAGGSVCAVGGWQGL